MNLRSLGYLTDLMFPAFDGEIIDRGEYLVVRSPANPTFYWGQFLLFCRPPSAGDYETWCDRFATEIGTPPVVEHLAFGWDAPGGEVGEVARFVSNGFELQKSVVMTLGELTEPRHRNHEIEIRPLGRDREWSQVVENQVLMMEGDHPLDDYREYCRLQMVRYRKMTEAGRGGWFGAFLGEKLVADLGVFVEGSRARYRSVQTLPTWQGRGIGGTLVFEAGRRTLERFRPETVVIVAEESSGPMSLYRSLGFAPREFQVGLERLPANPESEPEDETHGA